MRGERGTELLKEAASLREAGKKGAEIGRLLNLSPQRVSNLLRVLRLPSPVLSKVMSGQLGQKVAEALVGLEPARAEQVAGMAIAYGWSAEKTREHVRGGGSTKKSPDILHLEARLSEILACQVVFDHRSDGSGEMRIRYADADCLDGVMEKLGYTG